MIPASIAHACSALLPHLVAPAFRSLLLACFAALALGAFRVKNIAARLVVWTAVLYAALAMPLLGMMLPSVSLQVPAAAAQFLSRHFDSMNMFRGAGEPIETATVVAAVGSTSPDPYSPKPSPRVLHTRKRATPYVAPLATNSDSTSDMLPYSSPAKLPLPVADEALQPLPWIATLSALYFVVAGIFLARLLLGIVLSRGLVRSARPIRDAELTRSLALRAWEAGLANPPRLAESDSISVPVTLGIVQPIILFPAEWREWDAAALHAVIAHELSHVNRRDALTQRLSLLHRAIFWFSPLSWWLHRCLADVAEEASDEAALASGADRARYAETLLGFFAALQETPRRVYWQGVSMAKSGQAEKRLDRILAWKGDVGMRLNKILAIGMLLVGVPVVLLAAAARPSVADANSVDASVMKASVARISAEQTQAVDPVAPVAPASPATPVTPAASAPPLPAAPVIAPAMPMPAPDPMPSGTPKAIPSPPIPPSISVEPNVVVTPRVQVQLKKMMTDEQIEKLRDQMNDAVSTIKSSKDFAEIEKNVQLQLELFQQDAKAQTNFVDKPPKIKFRGPDGGFSDRYVIVSGDSPIFMSGDSQDVEHATALRGKVTGDFIWFQRDEKSYLIRDQATVNRAKDLFKPEEELGAKQQALGKQQQALGDQQRDIGKKMQTVQVPLPDMTADMQKIEAEMKQLSAGGTPQQLGDLQRQLGDLQRKIGQAESQAGDQQRKMSDPMRALGQQQRDLGDQQRALGEQQREASRVARDQMKQLLDDAVAHGTAQPE